MHELYTTLGEGTKTQLLAESGDRQHRKVTSCENHVAVAAAAALSTLHRCSASDLFDVAVAYAGVPVDARRWLLTYFDQTLVGNGTPRGDAWELIEADVADVARALMSAPVPVRAAVRGEVADILDGYDTVLVAGRLVANAYRPASLRVVLNQFLTPWTAWPSGEQHWPAFEGLDVEALHPTHVVDGVGLGDFYSDDLYSVVDTMRYLSSSRRDFAEASAVSIFSDSGDDYPALEVCGKHLAAWVAANAPALLETTPGLVELRHS